MKFRVNEDKLTPIDRQFLTMAALQGDAWCVNEWEIHTTDMGMLRSQWIARGVPILIMQLTGDFPDVRFRRLSWRGGILMQQWHREKMQSAMPEIRPEPDLPSTMQVVQAAAPYTARSIQQQMAIQQTALQQASADSTAYGIGIHQPRALMPGATAVIPQVPPTVFELYGHKLPKRFAENLHAMVEGGVLSQPDAEKMTRSYKETFSG